MKESLRIVVDTNVWISYLIGKNTQQLEQIISDDKIKIFASSKLLNELFSVLNRSKFSKLIPKKIIEEFSLLSENIFELIEVKSKLHICRDPEDNFLLELCKDYKADFLITGDNDLLAIKKFEETQIVTLRTFINEYNN